MLELRALGGLDLSRAHGRDILSITSQPKRLALLAYLSTASPLHIQRRDSVVAVFWPDLDEKHARNALNQALHTLRRALGRGALISRGKDGIGLSEQHIRCDVVAFERACAAVQWEDALELYRGDFLQGFHLSDAPEFERWLEVERERVRQLACDAARSLIEREERVGNALSATHWLRRLLDLSPADEASLRKLVRLLSRLGDRASAMRAYEQFARRMRREYDVAPTEETQALIESLRGSQHVPASAERERPEPVPLSREQADSEGAAIRSLAVLPLQDLSAAGAEEYFADGMTEALITEFGKLGALRVLSRQSVMRYKGSDAPLLRIARELDVDAVLEGSVLRDGERVRVTAQLIRTQPEEHLWAESYERELRHVLTLQSEIARAVARAVHVALTPDEKYRITQFRHVDPAAFDAYLRGRYFQHAQMGREIATGIRYFERAIEIDPNYAPAYAGQAICYCTLAIFANLAPDQAFPAAQALARQALAIDDSIAEAHLALAYTMTLFDWDWVTAEREFRRSLELDRGSGEAHGYYAAHLTWMGRFEEAIARCEQMLQVAPLDLGAHFVLGWTYHKAHRHDEAIEQLGKALELYPSFAFAHAFLAASLLLTGRRREAIDTVRAGLEILPEDQLSLGYGAWTLAGAGERQEATELLERLRALGDSRWVDPYYIAIPHVGLGEADLALEWLRRTYQERSSSAVHFRSDPLLDPVRSDPRFRALLQRMNFPPL
ncbi:MAG TPA: BTAD domain-containing putative transcriptional regulator [Gemmatimonadaceae bacterium]|nr:BTAD domain-containing putative transcriptional regulator [Gemmatimonadaceae bacterium]